LTVKEPWKDIRVKLIRLDASGDRMLEVPAKLAVFAGPGGMAYPVANVADPFTKKIYFLPGEYPALYVSTDSSMESYTVVSYTLRPEGSYWNLPSANNSKATALARFGAEFGAEWLEQTARANSYRDDKISFRNAAPPYFGSDVAEPGSLMVSLQAQVISFTPDALCLEVRNPYQRKTVTLWVNLREKKVIHSVVDGQEMNINTGRPWAEPMPTSVSK
jgi:hypothetical protein